MDLMGIDNFLGNLTGGLVTLLVGSIITIIPSWFVISRIKKFFNMIGMRKRAKSYFSERSHYIINGKEGTIDEVNKIHIVMKSHLDDKTEFHFFPIEKVDFLEFTKITAKQD